MPNSILDTVLAFVTAHVGFSIATGTTLGFWLVTLLINRRPGKDKRLSNDQI